MTINIPNWLIKRTPKNKNIKKIRSLLNDDSIHTVCESAKCPNIGECYSQKTVTFMILGNTCTRNCSFCAVNKGDPFDPRPLGPYEALRIATAVKKLNLKYVVITSVTRDDLPDGGAGQFVLTINEIRKTNPGIKIEVLIPDLQGNERSLAKIIDAKPNIINHNLETINRLYPKIRPQADYKRSLELLKTVKKLESGLVTKSGIMVGLGETKAEVVSLMEDLRQSNCDILTIGQYLQPAKEQVKVSEFVDPERFEDYRIIGEKMGFKRVFSGPFVRSSYKASETNVSI